MTDASGRSDDDRLEQGIEGKVWLWFRPGQGESKTESKAEAYPPLIPTKVQVVYVCCSRNRYWNRS